MTKTKKNTKRERVTRKPIKVWNREEVVDPKTGELVDRYSFEIEERDANFHKLWLLHIASALELIGNQKIKVLSYVLTSANSDNLFIGTMRGIAEKTDASTKTVNDTITMLLDADILRRQQAGVYLLNPDVMFKGGTTQRMDILYQYHSSEAKAKNIKQN